MNTMTLRPLLILALLACCACGKKDAPPATSATPATPAASATVAADDAAAAPDEVIVEDGIDEPMPPVDESGSIRVIARGALIASDAAAHPLSGTLTIYEADDGSRLLRLEDVSAEPLLDLALTRSAAPKSAADVQDKISIGALKSARGNMNYLLDSALKLGDRRALALIDPASGELRGYVPLQKP